jgi:hypothetical protein
VILVFNFESSSEFSGRDGGSGGEVGLPGEVVDGGGVGAAGCCEASVLAGRRGEGGQAGAEGTCHAAGSGTGHG